MTRVLVVDDDRWLAELLAERLTAAGYDVTTANDALAAIAAIDDALPDVLVLDFMLPAANAMALLHELKTYDDTAPIPVIICSAVAALPAEQLAQYGVRTVLDKTTMRPGDLVTAVREACSE